MTKTKTKTKTNDNLDLQVALSDALKASQAAQVLMSRVLSAIRQRRGSSADLFADVAERYGVTFEPNDELDDAELARQLEAGDVKVVAVLEGEVLEELRAAARERAAAEDRVARAVAAAREGGNPWTSIGVALGTSGEAARQRYGKTQ